MGLDQLDRRAGAHQDPVAGAQAGAGQAGGDPAAGPVEVSGRDPAAALLPEQRPLGGGLEVGRPGPGAGVACPTASSGVIAGTVPDHLAVA